jgi:hypothetical protein
MTTTEEFQQLGRAKNAALSFLERRLSVPKIYIDAEWDGHHVDLLAIDREGVGDVHVILLSPRPFLDDGLLNIVAEREHLDEAMERLSGIPAQFKYLAFVDFLAPNFLAKRFPLHVDRFSENSLAPDGLGRVGLLQIEVPFDNDPTVRMEIKPERFRAKIAKLADEYIQQHEADWEIRA